MKISKLIEDLNHARTIHGDLDVVVSVDMSTEDDATNEHRAFGDLIDWTASYAMGKPCDLILLAECGRLNFKPMNGRITELERDNKGWEDECRLFKSQRDEFEIQLFQAQQKLHLIGDFAHQRSAGPAIHDDLWWIRCQAFEAL